VGGESGSGFSRTEAETNFAAGSAIPGFSREFILTTDASNDGAGAVLSEGKIGKDAPIAYASLDSITPRKITVQLRKNWQQLCGE
jgi:hypothetical protein